MLGVCVQVWPLGSGLGPSCWVSSVSFLLSHAGQATCRNTRVHVSPPTPASLCHAMTTLRPWAYAGCFLLPTPGWPFLALPVLSVGLHPSCLQLMGMSVFRKEMSSTGSPHFLKGCITQCSGRWRTCSGSHHGKGASLGQPCSAPPGPLSVSLLCLHCGEGAAWDTGSAF